MNPPNTIASDTLVEAVARGIFGCELLLDATECERAAQAALTAIADAGMVIVPREPTEAIRIAMRDVVTDPDWRVHYVTEIYRAMIDAATHCNNNGKAE
jgi:hypothetical protein